MNKLKVFCDLTLDEPISRWLRDQLAPHELVPASRPARNVLAQGGPDPAMSDTDIAFGQPDATAVLEAPRLRWVQVASAGYTRYDTQAFRAGAAERGLTLTNSSSVYAEPCAEHVLAFMLAQSRRLPLALNTRCSSDSEQWRHLRRTSVLLQGQKVLILGFGAIGAVLLPTLRALQMHVVAFRRKPNGSEGLPLVNEQGLRDALPEADHVISLLPESASTVGFMSEERFAAMKPGAVYYNIGRGKTVDHKALVSALKSGHLGAAWLDVTEPEPLPEGHPLLEAPNCFISPHTAGGHRNELQSLVQHFADNFHRFVSGSPLKDRVM